MKLTEKLKRTARTLPFHSPLRDAYQKVFNRHYWAYRKEMRSFFSQFVRPGDLVFDVGANLGFVRRGSVESKEPRPSS